MPDNIYEKEYRNLMLRIGFAMLMFVLLINTLFVGSELLGVSFERTMDGKSAYILKSLVHSVTYLAVFLIPVGFFKLISKGRNTRPVYNAVRLTKQFPLMLVASIAVVFSMAYVNSYIMEWAGFNYDMFASDPIDANYKLILTVISSALVPACCEEYLFRGMVLSNILPYGKTNAIVVSAVLFGLMHQNPAQMLYATAAGIVLGLVYVRTRSIWGGVLIHFFNNLISVIQQMLFDRLVYERASQICMIMEAVLVICGVICAVVLLCTERRRKREFNDSGFGVILEPDEGFTEYPLKGGIATKRFFSPTMIIFIVISCSQMALYMLLSWGVLALS